MELIHVIEIVDNVLAQIKSFKIKDEKDVIGMQETNKEAEEFFKALIKENYPEETDEDIESDIENGYFSYTAEGYHVYITHNWV